MKRTIRNQGYSAIYLPLDSDNRPLSAVPGIARNIRTRRIEHLRGERHRKRSAQASPDKQRGQRIRTLQQKLPPRSPIPALPS
jgi:hypothetical protein